MAPRRRFFPSTKVQTVPGRTVELEMQLRPVAKAAAPAAAAPSTPPGDGEIFGVGWLGGILDAGTSIRSELLPDGRWDIRDYDGWRLESSIWEGTPVVVDPDLVVHPVPGPGFHCVELQVETTYYHDWPGRTYFGVIQGTAMADAHWEFEWDFIAGGNPAESRQGHLVAAYGNVLHLRAAATDTSSSLTDTLTAWAYVGGVQVGQLIFRGVGIAA